MRKPLIIAACVLAAACGKSDKSLQGAAAQSDPAAANVLESAAANGTDPQQALQDAGNAAAQTVHQANSAGDAQTTPAPGSLQARPNSLNNPNPRRAGEAPQKTVTNVQ